ncbi:MAG: hypothetical protein FJY77_02265 [Candidatus Altiarchaeales archaeon]|nr:hypothetical protein [Candidatus Altiarchaeales archaeon]
MTPSIEERKPAGKPPGQPKVDEMLKPPAVETDVVLERLAAMRSAFRKRAANQLEEGSPEMKLYREARVVITLVTDIENVRSAEDLLKEEDWRRLCSENKGGMTPENKRAAEHTVETAFRSKKEEYLAALERLDDFFKTLK